MKDDTPPVFTPAHVEYLSRLFPAVLDTSTSYTLELICRMQGSSRVVEHIRALVAKQTKIGERTCASQ